VTKEKERLTLARSVRRGRVLASGLQTTATWARAAGSRARLQRVGEEARDWRAGDRLRPDAHRGRPPGSPRLWSCRPRLATCSAIAAGDRPAAAIAQDAVRDGVASPPHPLVTPPAPLPLLPPPPPLHTFPNTAAPRATLPTPPPSPHFLPRSYSPPFRSPLIIPPPHHPSLPFSISYLFSPSSPLFPPIHPPSPPLFPDPSPTLTSCPSLPPHPPSPAPLSSFPPSPLPPSALPPSSTLSPPYLLTPCFPPVLLIFLPFSHPFLPPLFPPSSYLIPLPLKLSSTLPHS